MINYRDIPEGEVLLELENIHIVFGKIGVLVGVSLKVRKGEIHSIIGPNGAGKTSLLNCVSGFYHPTKGKSGQICGEKDHCGVFSIQLKDFLYFMISIFKKF